LKLKRRAVRRRWSEKKASLIGKEILLFLIVGAVFNRDYPGKSRLEAAPTSH